MNRIFNKITNWTFGAFFRSIGRFLFYIILFIIISFIIEKNKIKLPFFTILNVNAQEIYNLSDDPSVFEFGVLGGSYPTSTNVCYMGSDWLTNPYHIVDNSNYSASNGFLDINYSSSNRNFLTSDIFPNDTEHFEKRFYQLEFKALDFDNHLIPNHNDYYYFNILLATAHNYDLNNNIWRTKVNIDSSGGSMGTLGTGSFYYSSAFPPITWYYHNGVDLTLQIIPNGGNLYWLSYKIKLPSTFNFASGILIDYFIPDTHYVYCNNDNITTGISDWISILDANFYDSNFSRDMLTFNDYSVDEDNYYLPPGLTNPEDNPNIPDDETTNEDINNSITDINDSINNDNVDGATSEFEDFFNDFTTNNHGLTSIITAPLSFIQSLTSKTCSPLVLPLPYVNSSLTLPCMRSIYIQYFGGFVTIYDTITLGIISYWVLVKLFSLVKDFKNPEHDEIEVTDL